MPQTDLYITNGGYVGTLLAIEHALPMVAAGINEGKNEICARIGYFRLGIDLKTERPGAAQIKQAYNKVLADPLYKQAVENLRDEFRSYDTKKISADLVLGIIK